MEAAVQSPMQNRVTPRGEIVAIALRGAWLGNRGHIHEGTRIVRPYRGIGWVICELEHKGWRLQQWHPRNATILFFHDEAVALAAGHRPCALCRRASYNQFRAAWAAGLDASLPSAQVMDRRLHADRVDPRTRGQRVHAADWSALPDAAFVLAEDQPALVWGDALIPWTICGYGGPRVRPTRGQAVVLTPAVTVAALRGGYLPQVDDSVTTLTS
jgi:hypothetical protein